MTCRLMIALAIILPTIGTGSRLKQIGQHELLTTDTIPWKEGTSYVCLAKWEKSSKQYQDKWCLAPLDEVMKGMTTGAKKMKVTTQLSQCVAQSAPHRFKVCNLKGKKDRRLNYGEKRYVPKSCFKRLEQDLEAPGKDGSTMDIPVVAAVKLEDCKQMFNLHPTYQAMLGEEGSSSGKSKNPGQMSGKSVEPVTDADWNNIPAPVYVEDVTTTTTTTMDEDSVDEDETTTTTTIIIEDEVEVLDELGTDIDSAHEDSLAHVQDRSAEFNMDTLTVAQIRELWQKRDDKNK